jgi:hypothetical protein
MNAKVFNYEAAVEKIVKWGWGDAVASVPEGYYFWAVCIYDRRFEGGHGYDWLAIPVGTQPYGWNQVVYGQGEDDRAREYWQHGVMLWDEECGWRRPHYRQSPSGVWYHPHTVRDIPR